MHYATSELQTQLQGMSQISNLNETFRCNP